MDFVQSGGKGQTPNPNFFGVNFGKIEIKIRGRSRASDTYFGIQTLGTGAVDWRSPEQWTYSNYRPYIYSLADVEDNS